MRGKTKMMGISKKGGLGLTAFGAMAAVAVVTAPNASAVVQFVSVSTSTGTQPTAYLAGCQYEVTASVDASNLIAPVTFTDTVNGTTTTIWSGNSTIGATTLSAAWNPTVAGTHTITASAWLTSKTATVTVQDRGPLSSLLPASSSIGGCSN